MKYKHVIKSAFEEEERKEAMHIKALEKQILSKIQEEKILDQGMKTYFPQRNSFWTTKLPYAFAVMVIAVLFFGLTINSQVMAKGNILDTLINLKNQLQKELTNLLANDPTYRDKNTQKYKQTQKEWCSVSARVPEEQEKAVAAIRDFLDRSDANVEYECAARNPNKPDEKPKTETYSADFDLFFIDTRTNLVTEMSPKQSTWGENKDGSRWFSQQKQYDYTPRYTKAEVEKLARDFITKHEKSIGRIDLDKLTFESGVKDENDNKVNYFFIWKGEPKNADIPQLTLTFSQGGDLIRFSNQLSQ